MVTMHGLYLIVLLGVANAYPPTVQEVSSWPPRVGPVEFAWESAALDNHQRSAMSGVTWRDGCPVQLSDLRTVRVVHWAARGEVSYGSLVVAKSAVAAVVDAMRAAYADGFPIAKMRPMVFYGGDDAASMRDNNTSAFNCRPTTGGGGWSAHALGLAIDINPMVNPYIKGDTVLPSAGAAFADRALTAPGMLHSTSSLVKAFAAHGWGWGGHWRTVKDYQHVSATGR